jgi:hypothetical protein
MSIPCTLARRAERMDPSGNRKARKIGERPGVIGLAGALHSRVAVKAVEPA